MPEREVVVMAKGKYDRWVEPDGLLLLEGWARDGLTEKQIAKNCGIAVSTFSEWKNKYPDILEAIKKGKEIVDYEVENALLKRAKGYSYEEVKIEDDGEGETVKTTRILKHVPADVTAIAIWLNNRKPDKYRRNHNKEKLDEKRFEHDKEIDGKKYW